MFDSLTSKVVTAICAVVGAIALLGTFFLTITGGSPYLQFALERVMNLGENRIEMRIPWSAWVPRDLRVSRIPKPFLTEFITASRASGWGKAKGRTAAKPRCCGHNEGPKLLRPGPINAERWAG